MTLLKWPNVLYPFPNDKFFNLSKLKEFADDNFKLDENGRNLYEWVENIPTVFSKDLYCRHVKSRACLGKH